MYPTIIVILVNNQRSFVDTYGFSSPGGEDIIVNAESRPATFGHLSFAVPGTTQGTVSTVPQLANGRQTSYSGDGEVESDLEKADSKVEHY